MENLVGCTTSRILPCLSMALQRYMHVIVLLPRSLVEHQVCQELANFLHPVIPDSHFSFLQAWLQLMSDQAASFPTMLSIAQTFMQMSTISGLEGGCKPHCCACIVSAMCGSDRGCCSQSWPCLCRSIEKHRKASASERRDTFAWSPISYKALLLCWPTSCDCSSSITPLAHETGLPDRLKPMAAGDACLLVMSMHVWDLHFLTRNPS